MYLPPRQLEQRSVQTPTLDEPVHPEPPLFERRPNSISSRPYSAKDDNVVLKSINVRPGRPVSASKQMPASMANLLRKPRMISPRKERDMQALAKLRPRKIAIDKERLYDDALHLKIENNDLRSENTRLKTRVSQLDRELGKAHDRLDDAMADRNSAVSIHLVTGLKQTIKEQRQALKLKELEVSSLKKSSRSTKVEELEVELQTYAEECRRLQTALNDMMAYQQEPKESPARDDHDSSRREVAQLKNELKKMKIDAKNQADHIISLQQQLNLERTAEPLRGRTTDIEDLQRKLTQQMEEKRKFGEMHSDEMEKLRKRHSEELSQMKSQMATAQHELEQKVKTLDKEKQQEIAKSQAFAEEISHLRERFQEQSDSKQTFQESLETALQHAKVQLKLAEEELIQIREENEQLDGQVTDLSQVIAGKDEELFTLSEQLTDLRQDLEGSKAKIEDLESALASLRAINSRLETETRSEEGVLSSLSSEKSQLLAKVTDLESQLATLKDQLRTQQHHSSVREEENQTKLTALMMDHRKQMAEVDAQRAAMKGLEQSTEMIAQLKTTVGKLQSEMAAKTTEVTSLKNEVGRCVREIEDLQRQLVAAEKESAFLRSARESMSHRFSQVLTPHFAKIKQFINLDEMYAEDQEVDSAESFEQKLKSAHVPLDDTVSNLIISQLSDGFGNVSIKKLREEISAAGPAEDSFERISPVEQEPKSPAVIVRSESRESHNGEGESQPLFSVPEGARHDSHPPEASPEIAENLHRVEEIQHVAPLLIPTATAEVVDVGQESASSEDGKGEEKAAEEYEEEKFEEEAAEEEDGRRAPLPESDFSDSNEDQKLPPVLPENFEKPTEEQPPSITLARIPSQASITEEQPASFVPDKSPLEVSVDEEQPSAVHRKSESQASVEEEKRSAHSHSSEDRYESEFREPTAAAEEVDEHSEQHPEEHSDQHSDEHSDQHSDKHSDQHPDEHPDEHSDQHPDEHPDEHSDEHPDEHSDEHPDQHPDEHSEQHPDEHSEQHPDEHSEQHPDEHSEQHPDEGSDHHPDEHSDQHPDEHSDQHHPDKHSDQHTDEHPGEPLEVKSSSSSDSEKPIEHFELQEEPLESVPEPAVATIDSPKSEPHSSPKSADIPSPKSSSSSSAGPKEVLPPNPHSITQSEDHWPSEPLSQQPLEAASPDSSEVASPPMFDVMGNVPGAAIEESQDRASLADQSLQYEDPVVRTPSSSETPRDPRLGELCRHISYRMQISRVPKKNLMELLFEKDTMAPREVVKGRLQAAPLSIADTGDQRVILKALAGSGDFMQAELSRRLTDKMDDWRIFTQEDENEFDKVIGERLSEKAEEFKDMCEKFDTKHTGTISFSEFKEVLASLRIDLLDYHFRYLQLLFYSEEQKLDVVPYATLLRVFVPLDDDGEPQLSESQSAIVRTQLNALAAKLHENGVRLQEAFRADSRGLISPELFMEGMTGLGIMLSNEDFELLLQSLQAEEANEICISLEDLEDILASLATHQREADPSRSGRGSASEFNE